MKVRFLQNKRVTHVILALLLVGMAGMGKMNGQEINTLTINEPDEYNSTTSTYVPFNGAFDNNQPTYSQFIISANDLASMQYGEIQSMTFYISKDPYGYGYPGEMPSWNPNDDQFQIFFAEIDDETFMRNDSWEYELYNESEMALVFDSYQFGDSFDLSEDDDSFRITFYFNSNYTSNFYQYNGGNLLVYIKPSQITNTYYGCNWLGISQYQEGGYKAGDGPGAVYFNGDYVEEQQFLPMMTIEYIGGEAPSCPAPQDFEATPYAHGVTLTWTTDASKVNIQYKKSSDWDWTTAEENYEWYGYSYDLYGLSSQTEYNVQIQSICSDNYGNEEYSEWSLITFTTTTPIAPTHLTASNYDTPEATTATLNWEGDMYDTPIYWDLAYTTDMNASPVNSTIITISSDDYYSSYNMTGLTPLATYKVWIRSNFGNGEVSDWSEPCTFRPTNWENIIVNSGYVKNKIVPFPIANQSSTTSQSQFIIASDKLSDAAFHELRRIAFDPQNSNWYVEALPTATIQVYLKEIAATEFAATEFYNWDDMELVYNGVFSNSHKILEFDTPYNYMGGNLLVGICATTEYNASNYSSILSNYWYGISTNENVALSNINNGATSSQPFLPKTTFYYDPTESSSCYSPIYLTATATTSTTATLDWTPNGEESAWDMYYTTDASFTPDETTTPSVIATSQKPYVIEGLTNETTYYAWVRANCGGSQSNWSQRCTFLATDRIDLTVYDGTETVYSPIYGYGSNYKKQLVIPASELEDMIYGNIHSMMFYCKTAEASWSSPFIIYVAEIATSTLKEGYEYDWTAMTQVYQGTLSVANNKMTIVFDTPYQYEGGNLLIGITTEGSPSTKTWYGIGENQPKTTFSYLPGEAPAIARPQGLASSNVTKNTADLNWTDMDGMTWNLRYKNAEVTEWAIVNNLTNNSFQLTELTENTIYRVQVQAVNGENHSSWSYLTEFRTLCDIIVVDAENPYSNDFSTDPTEECWIANDSYYYDGSYVQIYGENTTSSLWMPSMHVNTSDDEIVSFSFGSSSDGTCSVYVNDSPIWESTGFDYRRVIISLNDYRGQDVSVKFQVSNGYWNIYDVRLAFGIAGEYDNVFVNEGDWNTPSNWSTGMVPTIEQNVLIMAAATVSSETEAYANSIMTLYGEGSVTIVDGGQVYCNTNFEGTIQKTVKGYGTGRGDWYLISLPLSNGSVNTDDITNLIGNSEYDFYYFDQSQNHEEWRNTKQLSSFFLEPLKGYLYANKTNVTLSYTGTLNVSETYKYLYYDANAIFKGWNLVGNPMVCNAYLADNRAFYRMNSTGTALEAVAANTPIAPMEGVFVEASALGEYVSFNKTTSGSNGGGMAKGLRMDLSQHQVDLDNAIISFYNGGTLGKFMLNANSPKIYFPVGGKDYAVVNAGTIGEMPLNFEAAENGTYTLSVSGNEAEMSYLHLIDNLTGNDIDLLETPFYSFDAKTTDYASRFKVVFAQGSTDQDDDFAFIRDGHLLVLGLDGTFTLQIVDMTGHVLSSDHFSGSYDKPLDLIPGVYMLRLINGENVKTQKMVVR